MTPMALVAQEVKRIGSPILGIIIPAFILIISFVIAFALYKHFTKKGV